MLRLWNIVRNIQKNVILISSVTMALFRILLLLTLPLSLMAEEVVLEPYPTFYTKYNLTYSPEFDFDYCIKNAELCNKLERQPYIPKFPIKERPSTAQWVTFWTFQVLDVYTTAKAVKYDCIKEINPLFTERPTAQRLLVTKTILLTPTFYKDNWRDITPRQMDYTNSLYLFVVANNFNLLNDAKENCLKIR